MVPWFEPILKCCCAYKEDIVIHAQGQRWLERSHACELRVKITRNCYSGGEMSTDLENIGLYSILVSPETIGE